MYLSGPLVDKTTNAPIYKHQALEGDGVCGVGCKVNNRMVMVNKSMPTVTRDPLSDPSGGGSAMQPEFRETPISYKGPIPSFIETVMLTSTADESFLVKILLRQT